MIPESDVFSGGQEGLSSGPFGIVDLSLLVSVHVAPNQSMLAFVISTGNTHICISQQHDRAALPPLFLSSGGGYYSVHGRGLGSPLTLAHIFHSEGASA